MPNRLSPQPVDTALARLVRRLVDRMPGASIGRVRRMEQFAAKQDNAIRRLWDEKRNLEFHLEHLHRDIRKLTVRVPPPTIDRVTVTYFRSDSTMDEIRKVKVTYIDQTYCCASPYLGRRMVNPHELSERGRRALEQSACEIATATAKTHAQYIIDATLDQGAFRP